MYVVGKISGKRYLSQNPLQRYYKYLKYANFRNGKIFFFEEKRIHSCVCQFFVVPLQPNCVGKRVRAGMDATYKPLVLCVLGRMDGASRGVQSGLGAEPEGARAEFLCI